MKKGYKSEKAVHTVMETAKLIAMGEDSADGIILGFRDGHLNVVLKGSVKTISSMIILASLNDNGGVLAEILDKVERIRKSVRDKYPILSAVQLAGCKAALIDIINENIHQPGKGTDNEKG